MSEGLAASRPTDMADLARNAFLANNLELAIKLYQQSIDELGPSSSLCVGLADCYAKAGRLKEALAIYKSAFRLGDVKPDELDHLITALVKMMTDNRDVLRTSKSREKAMFTCEICKCLWRDPITIPCGHTFCRSCLEKKQVKVCKICSYASKYDFTSLKCNVVIQNCIEKLYPDELEAVKLKDKGSELFSKGNYKQAAEIFTEAARLDPDDHLLASKCCSAFYAVDDFEKSLHYAQMAVELHPGWFQGYQCLGNSLSGLNLLLDATFAYVKCLALNPTATAARKSLAQCLHKLLSSSSRGDVTHSSPECCQCSKVQIIPSEATHVDISGILSELQNDVSVSCSKLHCEETVNKVKLTLRKELLKAQFSQLPSLDGRTGASQIPTMCCSVPQTPHLPSVYKLQRSKSDTILNSSVTPVGKRYVCCEDLCYPCTQTLQGVPKQFKSNKDHVSTASGDQLTVEDFECTLCYRLLYKPLTTPCGHVFCKQCLERSLDHSPNCPLCKSSLIQYIIEQVRLVTVAIEQIIEEYFPTESWQRKIQYENEIAELARMGQDEQHEIPIFVCILAFPSVSCPLHIFEPRYRLMIRQCIEAGTRQFGMCVCLESNEANFASYGTMLEIRDIEYLPDGRSLLTTVGGRRFRVLSRGMRDGYNTAKVEFLSDIRVPDEEKNAIWALHNLVRQQAENWFSSLLRIHHMRIVHRFGAFPQVEEDIFSGPNGPTWCWWLIAVLPIDRRTQLMMLAMTSLKDRLLAIHRVLVSVRENEPH